MGATVPPRGVVARPPWSGTARTQSCVRALRTVWTTAPGTARTVGPMADGARAGARTGLVPAWADVGLALVLVTFCVFGTGGAASDQGLPPPDALAYALMVPASLSVVLWRVRPVWTFAVTGVALVVYVAGGYPFGPMLIVAALGVYALTSGAGLRVAAPATGALVVAVVAGALADGGPGSGRHVSALQDAVSLSAWVIVPAAVGAAVRVRRGARAQVRAEQARRTASEERLRMAQELHDSIGHGLAVIAMQAGVALHVIDRSPERAKESLGAIRAVSTETLDGLRAELEVLRAPDGEDAPTRPAPTTADVPVLLARVRAGGLVVDDRVEDVPALPEPVGVAVYRILQEALTNVLRHAGAGRVVVTVARAGDDLRLEVVDDGSGGPASSPGPVPGSGIAGMRARAAGLGGDLEAGPDPAGGFAVRARLPLGPADGGATP